MKFVTMYHQRDPNRHHCQYLSVPAPYTKVDLLLAMKFLIHSLALGVYQCSYKTEHADSHRLLTSRDLHHYPDLQNKDLHVISLDDGTIANLTNTPNQQEDNATWSPDGKYLTYSAGVPGDETIWKIPFDKEAVVTGGLRPSLFGVGGQPVWSPDGQALAFIFRQQTTSYLIAANHENPMP